MSVAGAFAPAHAKSSRSPQLAAGPRLVSRSVLQRYVRLTIARFTDRRVDSAGVVPPRVFEASSIDGLQPAFVRSWRIGIGN